MNTLMESGPRRHRISVDDYHRMAEVGLLAPDARVELVEGEIIEMAPIGPTHAGTVNQLAQMLWQVAGPCCIVQVQNPVRIGASSELQPDIALLAARADFYRKAHPSPEDVLLLIEVSDSSLRYDLDERIPLYARHGIPEAWLVDLQHGELHFFRSPDSGRYADHSITRQPGRASIVALPGVVADLSGILGG